MTIRPRRVAIATLIGSLSLGLATPVLAQEAPTDDPAAERTAPAEGDRCVAAIERRLDHLATAQTRVDGVEAVTDDHEATIDGIIDATEAGLTQLRAAIETATDPAELRELCRSIAEDYRVYLVVLPQTHLTVAADRGDAGVALGDEALARLDEAIAAAAAAGADVAEAQAHRDAAVDHLAAADGANDGVADTVLAVTPADWNDGDGRTVLETARADLWAMRDELRGAREDARAATRALRDALADLD